jgi:SAM-dependent methyltransferase
MKPAEYEIMSDVEDEHWWYVGLRDLLARLLSQREWPTDLSVLDAGCGTGANLRFLQQQLEPLTLTGFDISPAAIQMARHKAPEADIYECNLCAPEFRAGQYDLILSCDVLTETGLNAARQGMHQLAASLRPGGWLIMNLAAYEWLKSEHDQAVSTVQRYTCGTVRKFVDSLGLKSQLVSYRMLPLFPAVVLARLPSILRRGTSGAAKSDLSIPPRAINGLLKSALFVENRMIRYGWKMPFGSSVICVAERPFE